MDLTNLQDWPDTFPLTNGVEPEPTVLPDHFTCLAVENRPWRLAEIMPQKVVELELAEEADPLLHPLNGSGSQVKQASS